MKHSALTKHIAIFVVVLMMGPQYLLAAAGTVRPSLPTPGNTGVSREQQEQIGQKAKAQVYQQMPILPDSSPVTQYVQQLGNRLKAVIPPQYSWPYEFHVVQQKEINAFALPGGPIFVNVGTIVAAKNEAQLAGVIAHEMSHVYMQHSIKAMKQQQRTGILAGIAGIAGAAVGLGSLGQVAAGTIGGLYSLHYSRGDESQADHVGAIIMYLAGYNPVEMANFFRQLESQGGTPPQFLSDHPNPGNRLTAIQDEIKNWPPKNWIANTAQFEQVRAQAQNVKAYSAQQIEQMAKNGDFRNQRPGSEVPTSAKMTAPSPSSVAPSGEMLTYDGESFSISHPSNWKVTSGNGGDTLIAPPSGFEGGLIAYGALINQARSSGNLDKDIQALVSAMQRDNPNMRTAGSPQVINVNGKQGRSQDLIGTSPIQSNGRPEQERDRLVIVPAGSGNILYVVFVVPESDYNNVQGTFESMLHSLQVR